MNSLIKAVVVCSVLAWPSVSFADHRHHDHDSHVRIGFGFNFYPDRYYYDPFYYPVYDPYYPPVIVQQAPLLYQPVTYVDTSAPAAPVQVTAAASTEMPDSFTVNIPSAKGGYTAVLIKKTDKGYIGPQGEFYSEFPKVAQLQVMYGK